MKVDFTKLHRAFNPRCAVVVGDKVESNFMWLRSQSTFKGKLHSVQVDSKSIECIKALGVENYTSLFSSSIGVAPSFRLHIISSEGVSFAIMSTDF